MGNVTVFNKDYPLEHCFHEVIDLNKSPDPWRICCFCNIKATKMFQPVGGHGPHDPNPETRIVWSNQGEVCEERNKNGTARTHTGTEAPDSEGS